MQNMNNKTKFYTIPLWLIAIVMTILSILIWVGIPLQWSMLSAQIMIACEVVLFLASLVIVLMFSKYHNENANKK
jgi:hypothetical protein